jgi:ABC-type glycerol-3-phosphate transport system substrate-binding protein
MSKKNSILIAAIAIILLAIIIFKISGYTNYEPIKNMVSKKEQPTKVTLEFWGVFDNSDGWQAIIDKYEEESHFWNGKEVQVKINYTKKDFPSYEADIESAYGKNASPSIYLINNYWLERYAESLEPLTDSLAKKDQNELTTREEMQQTYPPRILQDVVYGEKDLQDMANGGGKIYAIPTYSDTLALYYNKDLFAKAGIEKAPATWEELKADVKKLTVADKKNNITQSGIALGAGKNINRSCDIYSLLALQGGSKVINGQGTIDFNKKVSIQTASGTVEREPGITALQFYTEFSDTNKEIYAWNNTFTDSVQAFAEGKTAMMINYSYQIPNLLALKPELNYDIAPVPQLKNSTQITLSNSWFPVVSDQNSCRIEGAAEDISCSLIAWSFLSFANKKENIAIYLDAAGKASARTDLSAEQAAKDSKISAFAKQTGIARSYNKFDDRIDDIFTEMLDEAYASRTNWRNIADTAAAKIEELKK